MCGQFSTPSRWRRSAFTVPELIIGITLAGLLCALALSVVLTAKRLLPGRTLQVEGEVLPLAPSSGAFSEAIALHAEFLRKLDTATAVYVLGGEHRGLPASASRLAGAPLAAQALPYVAHFGAGLPLDGFAFYQAYQAELGPTERGRPEDFSVLVIGRVGDAGLAVTALAQVRVREVTVAGPERGRSFLRCEVRLYSETGAKWRYAFLEHPGLETASPSGARHFWYRYDEGRVAEEGPVVAVFPDPYRYAGLRSSSAEPQSFAEPEVPPLSRFVYLLSVNPS